MSWGLYYYLFYRLLSNTKTFINLQTYKFKRKTTHTDNHTSSYYFTQHKITKSNNFEKLNFISSEREGIIAGLRNQIKYLESQISLQQNR